MSGHCVRVVVVHVLAVDDMNDIISNMSLLCDLLSIIGIGGHVRDFMEDYFHYAICIIRCRITGRQVRVKPSQISSMRLDVDLSKQC